MAQEKNAKRSGHTTAIKSLNLILCLLLLGVSIAVVCIGCGFTEEMSHIYGSMYISAGGSSITEKVYGVINSYPFATLFITCGSIGIVAALVMLVKAILSFFENRNSTNDEILSGKNSESVGDLDEGLIKDRAEKMHNLVDAGLMTEEEYEKYRQKLVDDSIKKMKL